MFRAKYTTGSQLVLPNPHDKDFLLIYDTREESREALIHNRDHTVDWHYDSLDRMPKLWVGCYIYHFMELVEGEELDCIKNYNFLDHKEEYTELFKRYVDVIHEHKWWYHFYLAYVFFKKGKMTLTKKEKEKAQEIHDNGISEEDYETIVKYFTEEEQNVESNL